MSSQGSDLGKKASQSGLSRRSFLLRSPEKVLRDQVQHVSSSAAHPKFRGPVITGVDGGLAWDILASQSSNGSRFTAAQEEWSHQTATIGGYFVPLDPVVLEDVRYVVCASPAHCVACLDAPLRWRVLVTFDQPVSHPDTPMRVTGMFSVVHQTDAPFFYRLHSTGPDAVTAL